MSMETWGPGLEAELAYRRERLVTDLAPWRDQRSDEHRRPARRTAPRTVGHGRRWWLLGSGTWHVAR